MNISINELLTDRELAKGIPIPSRAPEKEIAAATFPFFIKLISLIGVSSM